jgi:hypothetical protein
LSQTIKISGSYFRMNVSHRVGSGCTKRPDLLDEVLEQIRDISSVHRIRSHSQWRRRCQQFIPSIRAAKDCPQLTLSVDGSMDLWPPTDSDRCDRFAMSIC